MQITEKRQIGDIGENPGSKYDKAKELNIPILSEEDFLALLNK